MTISGLNANLFKSGHFRPTHTTQAAAKSVTKVPDVKWIIYLGGESLKAQIKIALHNLKLPAGGE